MVNSTTYTMPCCYCDDQLEFRKPVGLEPFAATEPGSRAWLHSRTGAAYAGECNCAVEVHSYSHNAFGFLVCLTWRDDHAATPRRS